MMTTWKKSWSEAGLKGRALAIASALAAAFLIVAGCSLLASWDPVVERITWWGAPAWVAPLAGGTLLALAALLVIDDAAFYAALAATVALGVTAFAWANAGSLALALMPAIGCALAAIVMALRSDVPRVHVERVTQRYRHSQRRDLAHG